MKVTFLGTGAATAYPLPFCRCGNCEQARLLGGTSLRKRSSLLINGDLVIDLGPDIMASSFAHNFRTSDIRYCLQTHPHSDHLDISHLFSRHPEYAPVDVPRLHLYASAATLQKAAELSESELAGVKLLDPICCKGLNLEIHEVEALQTFEVSDYQVTAFSANHDASGASLLYAVRSAGWTIFYGTDTAASPERTWQGFHLHKLVFDVFILDHTYGPGISREDHLDALKFIEHVSRLHSEGLLNKNARIFATHISHEGNPVHPQLADFAAQHGYEVAYDGLTIEAKSQNDFLSLNGRGTMEWE
jgi:phosphoribosyl 1,2-cyclic phosphate phosphodiesterase